MRERLSPGDEFAGYRLERELGRGGMGVVYLAEQVKLGRRVALKVVTPQFASDARFRARFEREARHAASIDHRNVVPIYAADSAEGLLFLAMRYIEGTDLRAALAERGVLDAGLAAHMISEVAKALDAAHAKGLVHRDVKPANVLLSGHEDPPDVYLTDFGLTKDAGSQSGGLTNTGQWVGTLNYVAPEQLGGSPTDARSDVYSLGCVLFELLSGRLPYEGADAQKMWGHAHEAAPALSESDAELGHRFDPVLARAMAKDPDERYPSAGDLGRAALAAAAGTIVSAPERSVATGAAAPGLGIGHAPTRTASPSPIGPGPGPEPVRQASSTRSGGPTVPLAPEESQRSGGGGRRLWLGALLGLVLLALGAATAALLADGTNDNGANMRTPASEAQTETVTVDRPTPEPQPEPTPVGVWQGSALQRTPDGTTEPVEISLEISNLDTAAQASGRLEGQPRSGSGCGGTLRFVSRRNGTSVFMNTETENVPGCVDETTVTVTSTDDRLAYLETWTTDGAQGEVRGTLDPAAP